MVQNNSLLSKERRDGLLKLIWGNVSFSFNGRWSNTVIHMFQARKSPASSLGVVRLANAGVLVDGGSYIARRETP